MSIRPSKFYSRVALLGVGLVSFGSGASAFDAPSSAAASALGIAGGPNPDRGIPIEGWIFQPSLFVGAIYNDNLYKRQAQRVGGAGVRIRPTLEAWVDNGIHKSTAYFMADVQAYPGVGSSIRFVPRPTLDVAPTNATGRAGFAHIWEPMADLKVRAHLDYTRQNGLFGSNFGGGEHQVGLLSANTVSGEQQYSNQFSGYVSAQKDFAGKFFLRGTTGAQYVSYDSRPSDPAWLAPVAGGNFANRSQDGLAYTGSIRGGMWLTPQLYGFVEPGADLRFYRNSWSDTNGYRILSGLGSDLIGLFRGEIYGGYQSQTSARGYFGTTSSPAFGARIFYYPTPYITLTASVDQTLSSAATQPSIGRSGAPLWVATTPWLANASSKTLQARLQGDYRLSDYWSAYVRGGYGETRWSAPYNLDTVWTAGVGLNYNFWRNIALTLEYQFSRSFSTNNLLGVGWIAQNGLFPPGWPSGYSQNIVSAGLTYHY